LVVLQTPFAGRGLAQIVEEAAPQYRRIAQRIEFDRELEESVERSEFRSTREITDPLRAHGVDFRSDIDHHQPLHPRVMAGRVGERIEPAHRLAHEDRESKSERVDKAGDVATLAPHAI